MTIDQLISKMGDTEKAWKAFEEAFAEWAIRRDESRRLTRMLDEALRKERDAMESARTLLLALKNLSATDKEKSP